jgi:hypothetical protein
MKFNNLSELAHAMGISVSQVYRVREGKRSINQKFVIGAVKAFAEYKLEDLFYLASESPIGTNGHRLTHSVPYPVVTSHRLRVNSRVHLVRKFYQESKKY